MAYWDQSLLSQDSDFIYRVASCAAVEVELTPPNQPTQWASEHIWFIAAAPGFAEAYAYALATNVENPGRDQSVIADNEILAAVQAIIANETPA